MTTRKIWPRIVAVCLWAVLLCCACGQTVQPSQSQVQSQAQSQAEEAPSGEAFAGRYHMTTNDNPWMLTIDANGTFTLDNEGEIQQGSWELSGDTLSLDVDYQGEAGTWEVELDVSGDIAVYIMEDGERWTYYPDTLPPAGDALLVPFVGTWGGNDGRLTVTEDSTAYLDTANDRYNGYVIVSDSGENIWFNLRADDSSSEPGRIIMAACYIDDDGLLHCHGGFLSSGGEDSVFYPEE